MHISKLSRDEISKFYELDRRETMHHFYKYQNGGLILQDEYYEIPDWSRDKKTQFILDIKALFDRGGTVYGAFEGDLLIGMATLDSRFLGKNNELLNLNGLWVSRDFRKTGIATKLIEQIKKKAIDLGAKGLYVSATESKNTVEFYLKRGFKLADHLDEELFKKEPNDIHMILHFDRES